MLKCVLVFMKEARYIVAQSINLLKITIVLTDILIVLFNALRLWQRSSSLAVNPVNGFGLFQYLEAFFENGISYKVYAVAETKQIKTNSGVELVADDIIAHLVGHEDEFDAVVFSCGDAVPVFAQNADKPYNIDLMSVLKAFGEKGKILIGHCAAGMLFDFAGVTEGKKLAVHPLAKPAITKGSDRR
mgnify:CR=1 FL=1